VPEGDTVHRIAAVLSGEVRGRTLRRLELKGQGEVPELEGRAIESVRALGKHMLVRFAGGWTLRVHLGMKGRWRRLHIRQRRPGGVTVVLEVGETAYICHGAYRAELVRTAHVSRHPKLARLGPDLLADPPDLIGAVRRARHPAYAGREIGELVMDQRVAAGIGNVYKSEVLFECGIHPRTPVGALDGDTLQTLFATAAELMRRNLGARRRTHVPLERRPAPSSQRLWVYGRKGEPCLECGTPVQRFVQGDTARSTYFCPHCQPRRS
jgi:endonuclease-8